jgi:putative pre-16S rRNA nuclease
MKVLGVDHGKKRVGVAVSDLNRVHAFPLEVIPGSDRHRLLTRLQALISEHQVSDVVVGLPLTMSGEVGPQARRVQEFVERLRRKLGDDVQVSTWDERLSSAQADRGRGKSKASSQEGMRDMMAAVVILQSYLDRKP